MRSGWLTAVVLILVLHLVFSIGATEEYSEDVISYADGIADGGEYSNEVPIGYDIRPGRQFSGIYCPAPFGLYPHPYDCRWFLNCDRGTPHQQQCGPGTVFSKRHRVCVHFNREDCPW